MIIPFGRVLKLGSVGNDVKAVKRSLARAGFGPKKLAGITPIFGPFSVKYLKQFQKKKGRPQSGTYGPLTHRKLVPYFDAYSTKLYLSNQKKYVFPINAKWKDCGGPCAHVGENGPNDIWQDNSAHDLCVPKGTPVFAVTAGRVSLGSSQSSSPAGHTQSITLHADAGPDFWYGHLTGDPTGNSIRNLPIKDGQRVKKGQIVGYVNKWDLHLHIAVDQLNRGVNASTCKDKRVDPLNWVKK